MHTHTLDAWRHEHVFLGAQHDENERRSWLVVSLTATMMIVEIVGGMMFGSMALIADGWHMSTHAGAPPWPTATHGSMPTTNVSHSARGRSASWRGSQAHSYSP